MQSEKGWLLNGVAINGHPKAIDASDGALALFWKITRSYFYNSAGNETIDVIVNEKKHVISTDKDGNFELLLKLEHIDKVEFQHSDSGAVLDVLQDDIRSYSISNNDFLVISDIDDTILVSHSARMFSKLWLMLFKPIPKRRTVEESELAYRELKKNNFPFAYVSASEYNLFSLVSSFIELHKLPRGPIYLRPHQEFKNLFFKSEREDYKVNRIASLISHFETKKLVLFGDDSQQDSTVFGIIAEKFPKRIHSVYLRKTGSLKPSKLKEASWEMPGGQIPVYYYDSYTDIRKEIQKLTSENRSST